MAICCDIQVGFVHRSGFVSRVIPGKGELAGGEADERLGGAITLLLFLEFLLPSCCISQSSVAGRPIPGKVLHMVNNSFGIQAIRVKHTFCYVPSHPTSTTILPRLIIT